MTTCCTRTTPTGRWNLWREHLSADLERHPVAPADADTGGPLWVLGTRWFARLDDGRIVAVRTNGDDELVLIHEDGAVEPFPVPVDRRDLRRGRARIARAPLGRFRRLPQRACG